MKYDDMSCTYIINSQLISEKCCTFAINGSALLVRYITLSTLVSSVRGIVSNAMICRWLIIKLF